MKDLRSGLYGLGQIQGWDIFKKEVYFYGGYQRPSVYKLDAQILLDPRRGGESVAFQMHYLHHHYVIESKNLYNDMCQDIYLSHDIMTFFVGSNGPRSPRPVLMYHMPSDTYNSTWLSNHRMLREYAGNLSRRLEKELSLAYNQ